MHDNHPPGGLAAWLKAEPADAISDIRNTWENFAYGKDVHSGGEHGKMADYYTYAREAAERSLHEMYGQAKPQAPENAPQAERLSWGDVPDHTADCAKTPDRDRDMER